MERRLFAPAFLLVSLLFVGCSPGPGSQKPAPGSAGPPAARSQETPTATGTTAPSEAAPPAATHAEASTPPGMERAQVAARQQPAQVSKPPVVSAPGPAPREMEVLQPTVEQTTPAPRPETTKAPLEVPQAPAAARAPIAVDVGGLVEVGATKPGLSPIGAGKCKLCHKVQFDSWSKTAHAARTPPLDCEACHGPGSEYKTLAIMKDPKKARAAGLVIPVRSFCARCHTSGWSDDLLKRSHAHKAGA